MEKQQYSLQNIRQHKVLRYYVDLKVVREDKISIVIEKAQYVSSPRKLIDIKDEINYIRLNILVDSNKDTYVEFAQLFVNSHDVTAQAMLNIRLDDTYITWDEINDLLAENDFVKHSEITDFAVTSTITDTLPSGSNTLSSEPEKKNISLASINLTYSNKNNKKETRSIVTKQDCPILEAIHASEALTRYVNTKETKKPKKKKLSIKVKAK